MKLPSFSLFKKKQNADKECRAQAIQQLSKDIVQYKILKFTLDNLIFCITEEKNEIQILYLDSNLIKETASSFKNTIKLGGNHIYLFDFSYIINGKSTLKYQGNVPTIICNKSDNICFGLLTESVIGMETTKDCTLLVQDLPKYHFANFLQGIVRLKDCYAMLLDTEILSIYVLEALNKNAKQNT